MQSGEELGIYSCSTEVTASTYIKQKLTN